MAVTSVAAIIGIFFLVGITVGSLAVIAMSRRAPR
jgi:hypothetical protein